MMVVSVDSELKHNEEHLTLSWKGRDCPYSVNQAQRCLSERYKYNL